MIQLWIVKHFSLRAIHNGGYVNLTEVFDIFGLPELLFVLN